MATKSIEILIDEFNRLPGIGRKSAARLAFHVLEMDNKEKDKDNKTIIYKLKDESNLENTTGVQKKNLLIWSIPNNKRSNIH
ncbi:MAG: hypothetical protein RSC71_03240, partial [Cetobacterium sp.]